MAGTTWPALTSGKKAKASDVESKFDWIEGTLTPMNAGSKTNGAYDLGEASYHWNNAYINTIANTVTVNNIDGTVTVNGGVLADTLKAVPVGVNFGLEVTQNQEAVAISVVSTAADPGKYCLECAGKYGVGITQNTTSGLGLAISRNINEAGDKPLVEFTEDHSASTQPVLEIDNDGQGEEIKFTHVVTRYYSIHPGDFVPKDVTSGTWYITDVLLRAYDSGGTPAFVAGIHLPHGAIITDLKSYWYRDHTTSSISLLLQRSLFTGTTNTIATGTSDTVSGYHNTQDNNSTNATIDNNVYNYFAYISIECLGSASSTYFTGAVITYTIQEPLP